MQFANVDMEKCLGELFGIAARRFRQSGVRRGQHRTQCSGLTTAPNSTVQVTAKRLHRADDASPATQSIVSAMAISAMAAPHSTILISDCEWPRARNDRRRRAGGSERAACPDRDDLDIGTRSDLSGTANLVAATPPLTLMRRSSCPWCGAVGEVHRSCRTSGRSFRDRLGRSTARTAWTETHNAVQAPSIV